MNLDDTAGFGAVDVADALADVESTAEQWRSAAAAAPAPVDLGAVDAVVVSGMGGSGIAGDIVSVLALERFGIPVVVHKGYGVPGFTGPRTLVVSFSHSGSTEETLSGFEAAGRRGATRLAITSGGPLAQRADAQGARVVRVPGGSRPPRHSLGVLLVPALAALGLDDGMGDALAVLDEIAAEQFRAVPVQANPAKQLAQRIARAGAIPLAWGGHGIGAVAAYRLKCQLNENAKLPALHAELPEADHNDIVGWEQPSSLSGSAALIALRDPAGEHPQVTQRFAVTSRLLGDAVTFRAEITARGEAPLARLASLLLQADLVSVYTALALDRDPTPIASIDRLKGELAAAADAADTDQHRAVAR